MKILSTLAVKGVLDEITPRFEAAGDPHMNVSFSYDPTVLMLRRVLAGERADVAFLTTEGMEELAQAGIIEPSSRVLLAMSEVGVAIKPGCPRPDLSTVEGVRRSLLAAKSIAYSKTGASGIFFAKVIDRLGITDAVNAKAVITPGGFTAEMIAQGRTEMAIQQVSELMVVPGVDVVGPFPPEIQENLSFEGGVFAGATDAAVGHHFLQFLADPRHADIYRAKGLLPVVATV